MKELVYTQIVSSPELRDHIVKELKAQGHEVTICELRDPMHKFRSEADNWQIEAYEEKLDE